MCVIDNAVRCVWGKIFNDVTHPKIAGMPSSWQQGTSWAICMQMG